MEYNFLQAILQHDAKTNIGSLFYRTIFTTVNGATMDSVDINEPVDPQTVDQPLEEEPAPNPVGSEAV